MSHKFVAQPTVSTNGASAIMSHLGAGISGLPIIGMQGLLVIKSPLRSRDSLRACVSSHSVDSLTHRMALLTA